jgi:hypothetical protein
MAKARARTRPAREPRTVMSRNKHYKQEDKMSFNVLFIAHAPDADKRKHRSEIDTGKYHLFSAVVRNQTEAIDIVKEIVNDRNIDTILLCPGFTHLDVAEIYKVLDGRVGVAVARGDGPSNRISAQARRREDYAKS